MTRRADLTRNVVLVACLAGALGIVAVRRLPRWIGEARAFGDGRATWSDVRASGVRHAVWDTPRSVGALDDEGPIGRVAPAPDGRWLVFAAGSDAAGWDLWTAELGPEGPQRARPLAGASGAADELAPAFHGGELWFASDRAGGAGGFDLWRAPFAAGELGEPEPLHGLNSPADELDPAPGRDWAGRALAVFASDRDTPGAFALYEAALAPDAAPARALAELDGAGDEREPCLSADGASLYFARVASEDVLLLRSFRDGAAWHAPHAPEGLRDVPGARSPALSADGFTLWLTSDGAPLCAASRELVPLPLEDLGWKDLALVAALLLTALLAWLSRRWHELEVIYKCLLASILVHLLALWLLREVRPEGEIVPGAPEQGPTFRVRVLEDSSLAARQAERGGELELQRSSGPGAAQPQRLAHTPEPAPASPSAAELHARASELAAGPSAAELELARAEAAGTESAPELSAPSEQFERLAASSPQAPAAQAHTLAPSQRSAAVRTAQPERAELAAALGAASPAAPATADELARPAAQDAQAPGPAREQIARAAAPGAAPAPGVAAPSESFAVLDAPAPAPAPRTAQGFEPAPDTATAPARAEGALLAAAAADVPRATVPSPAPVLPARAAPLAAAAPPAAAADIERETAAAPPAVALAAPVERFEPLGRAPTPERAAPRRPEAASFAPARAAQAAPAGPTRLEAPPPRELAREEVASAPALEARPRAEPEDLPRAPERLFDTPYRTRFGAQKTTALREHGGGVETEAAVARGLAYLASVQNQDGSWGRVRARHEKYGQVAVGKTGLCFLAFLGAGHTPGVGEHGETAERALRFLLSVQDQASGHFGDGLSYSHGIATYALAECYALSSDQRLRAPLEAAVARILAAQVGRGPDVLRGGWGYFGADGPKYDAWPRVSISAWQVMALESARLGGLEVPDTAFDAARDYLLRSWDPRLGAFRYSHDPSRLGSGYPTLPGSTPAALFALALLGEDLAAERFEAARRFVDERAPRGYAWRGDDAFVERADANLYFWYYGTLACFRLGGTAWERWNTALKQALLPTQLPDGSWEPLDLYARDYADDRAGDLSYTTALCVLSLEVYYRYFTPLLRVR